MESHGDSSLEVVADVVAMIVREQHQDGLGLLAGEVSDEPLLVRVLGRLADPEAVPPGVVPDPGVVEDDVLVIGRRNLGHAAA